MKLSYRLLVFFLIIFNSFEVYSNEKNKSIEDKVLIKSLTSLVKQFPLAKKQLIRLKKI